MEIKTKTLIIGAVLVAASASAATKYLWPSIETKIETRELIKNNVVTVVKTVKEPGGREETVTTIIDKTVKDESKLMLVSAKPQWRIGGGIDNSQNYYGQIERRILGPVFISVGLDTVGTMRAGLSIEF